MMPPWHHWEGRPITVGTVRGQGGGRSLIVNGHIDVVSPGDLERWTTPPFAADVRDGRIYGRGAVDMKGGVAAALFALRALADIGVRLRGDVIFEAVPDEETCAMGTVAAIERGYRADAGLVPEPTLLNLWIATRGLLHGSFVVPGRSAHAEVNQARWEDGGGVNAIERAVPLLASLGELSGEWRERARQAPSAAGDAAGAADDRRGGAFISNVPEALTVAPQRHLPAGRRGRRRVRQRPARGDRRCGRGQRRPRLLAARAPGAVDLGDGLPAVGDPARRGDRRDSPATSRATSASRAGSMASTRPTTVRC